jgi:hypothetical protein
MRKQIFGDGLQAVWWENVGWIFCPVCHSCIFSYIQRYKIVRTFAAWRCFLWYVSSNVSDEPAASILSIEEDSLPLSWRQQISPKRLCVATYRTYCTSSPSILGLRLQTLTGVSIVQVAGCLLIDEICVLSGGTKVSYCPACRPAGDNKHVDLASSTCI